MTRATKAPTRPLVATAHAPAVRDLGALLRTAFASVESAPLPDRLQRLLDQLGQDEPAALSLAPLPLGDAAFKAALAAAIPQLRAYGRSLSGNADLADDLVQDTMLKAWMARDRFVAGSSMRAWTHVILRNAYFSLARRARFRGEWDEYSADLLLAIPASQESHVALADMQRAMMQLPAEQREALILMGASGMSCEEVAAISDCAVGTVKSRVARARAALRILLDGGQLAQSRADAPAGRGSALDQI
uniref:sigma-70 family RNA polymerase sigma factor n=1 Tax=Sandarakinorhabdus oryzae TaxID=2675220 RepID=UPI0012E182E2